MNKQNQSNNFIKHDERFVALLASHRENPTYKATLDKYNKKIFKVSDTKISYRTINSWENAGLLLSGQNKEAKWRKFTIIEVLWLQIIRELRILGFSTKKILNLKNNLFQVHKQYGDQITDTFAVHLFSINAKRDVMIVINIKGDGDFLIDFEYELSQRNVEFPNTHVVLSINKIYADFSEHPELRAKNQFFYIYNDKELAILNAVMNDPNIREIVIKPENGKIKRLDFKRHERNPENVMEFVRNAVAENVRRDITIKIEPNKVVLLEDVRKT